MPEVGRTPFDYRGGGVMARKYKIHKVRCMRCGHVSWWRSDHRYECAECGSKQASAVDLVREALREQRADVQRRLVAKKGMDAFFNLPQYPDSLMGDARVQDRGGVR